MEEGKAFLSGIDQAAEEEEEDETGCCIYEKGLVLAGRRSVYHKGRYDGAEGWLRPVLGFV